MELTQEQTQEFNFREGVYYALSCLRALDLGWKRECKPFLPANTAFEMGFNATLAKARKGTL